MNELRKNYLQHKVVKGKFTNLEAAEEHYQEYTAHHLIDQEDNTYENCIMLKGNKKPLLEYPVYRDWLHKVRQEALNQKGDNLAKFVSHKLKQLMDHKKGNDPMISEEIIKKITEENNQN